MKKALLLSLAAALFFAACKKKTPGKHCETKYFESVAPDTVLPSSYIMAYPGSIWNYDDGTTRTCSSWEQVDIVDLSTLPNGCKTVSTTHTIVPSTSFGYIHGLNQLSVYGPGHASVMEPLLATVPGIFYNHGTNPSGGTSIDLRTVTETLDSMSVLGVTYYDVIHVHQKDSTYFYHVYHGPYGHYDMYYANNVGLIRMESQFITNPTEVRNLVSYVIGPH